MSRGRHRNPIRENAQSQFVFSITPPSFTSKLIRTRVASYWPPLRILITRVMENTLNPAWRLGSFAVQRGVERTIQAYLSAISAAVATRARGTTE
jgi:hypothetical protein